MPEGPDLAERQLRDLAGASSGAVEVLRSEDTGNGRWVTISMDTSGIPTVGGGILIRDRERFQVLVGATYPFHQPSVKVPHTRWGETAHVQWGSTLCLYAAPSVEWVPSDGMVGFVERLMTWLVRAGTGTLDPDGQPLHPPVTYSSFLSGTVVVHPDVGDRAPWLPRADGGQRSAPPLADAQAGAASAPAAPTSASMVAWCTAQRERIDVLEWIDWNTAHQRLLQDGADPFHDGRPLLVLPVLLLDRELGFEYPIQASQLASGLEGAGYGPDLLLNELAHAVTINRLLRLRQVHADPGAAGRPFGVDADGGSDTPLLTALLLGTPSRRVDVGRLTHFAAWSFQGAGRIYASLYADVRYRSGDEELLDAVRNYAAGWLQEATVTWMRVLEDRPEVTRRRDQGTAATWLTGKRVLVFGAGALGAPVAHHCVRAGAAALHVVDNGLVTPGILVRQPYDDADVCRPKAQVLGEQLRCIRPGIEVEGRVGDALSVLLGPDHAVNGYDLIIDATADAGVRAAVERRRRTDATEWPALVTMLIGHDAARGLVTVDLPGSTGAGTSALRRVALHASAHPGAWLDIADDFFPTEPRTDMFFPEPGCSAPTFIGGSMHTAPLAGLLFDEALQVISAHAEPESGRTATAFAAAVRTGAAAMGRGTSRAQWGPDIVVRDSTSGYDVRLSPEAVTEMRTEVRRGARVRGPLVEAGGMLLGAVDDAAGIVHVDRVTGPPSDSFLSVTYFQHGQDGAQRAVEFHLARSRGMTGFVGYWHSHPQGHAAPSPTDHEGMASVVDPDGRHQRALMVIIGGRGGDWDRWVAGDSPGPAVFARLVPRASGSTWRPAGTRSAQDLPSGDYFRGGFSPPDVVTRTRRAAREVPEDRRSRWPDRWRRRTAGGTR